MAKLHDKEFKDKKKSSEELNELEKQKTQQAINEMMLKNLGSKKDGKR